MNILFLSLLDFNSLEEHNIYTDLLRIFRKNGDSLYIVSPVERRKKQSTRLIKSENTSILKLRCGNIQKTNLIEKGISTLTVEQIVKNGIKKYFFDVKFDLVLYTTPPITFAGVISYIKKRDGAKSYLLLKDIFPQNAVDIGMMSKSGPKGLLYRYFRRKEKKLYALSDFIGCMSQANVDFVLRHNPELSPEKVHVSPNSMELRSFEAGEREAIREKYGIPQSVTAFIYGGNLGKPQGISHLVACLRAMKDRKDVFFAVCGTGTHFSLLKEFAEQEQPANLLLLNGLPKEEYEAFVKAFDVGLIFLDHRFTIPNFPSRLLSYMQAKMPVIACTDPNTDIGRVIEAGGFGWWCESNDPARFTACVDKALAAPLAELGEKGYEYLKENYTVEQSYRIIMERLS
ncbi:MAG: glycosyltransferase family 4 protein [Clostridia bacterium]|nr:glycosyltransferase family 4 protein [Clostridia bacterium]